MDSKLFVGNLSFETTENDLQDTFAAHGNVMQVDIPQDRMTNKARGFGFVTMSSKQEADAAVYALNGTELHGRALTVNEARPREERGGNGGGRGGYGASRGGSSRSGGRSYAGGNRY
jgi:cold-inducible RNA-binding protein